MVRMYQITAKFIICIAKLYVARLHWVYSIAIHAIMCHLQFLLFYIGLTITNGSQNTTICINTKGEISCGFTEDNPNLAIPDWRIITRNDNCNIVSNETLWGLNITRNYVSPRS